MPDDLAAHIRPRTTFNKLGLIVTSQHVNPSFYGKLLKERTRGQLKKDLVGEVKKLQLREWRRFLVETILLAGIVGLIVNQLTDLVTLAKAITSFSYGWQTIFTIIIFIVILAIYVVFSYLRKLEEFAETTAKE